MIPHPQISRAKKQVLLIAGTEEEILDRSENLVSMLPANNEDEAYTECEDDLNRACADLANCAGDTGILLSQLSDNGIYF